jgi:hypothetical protein
MAQPPWDRSWSAPAVYPEIEFAASAIRTSTCCRAESDTISYVPAIRFEARRSRTTSSAIGRIRVLQHGDRLTTTTTTSAGGDWTLAAHFSSSPVDTSTRSTRRQPAAASDSSHSSHYRQPIVATCTYGAQDAAGRLELQAAAYTKTYDNNRRDTLNQPQTEALDHSRTELTGTLLVRVQPKTYATLTARQYAYEYTEAYTTRDSDRPISSPACAGTSPR